jgi:hypothetical protein
MRVIPALTLTLAAKQRIVKRRMHAAAAPKPAAADEAAAEGIVGPEPRRVQVAAADAEGAAGGGEGGRHAAQRAVQVVLVVEAGRREVGIWAQPAGTGGEGVVEGVGPGGLGEGVAEGVAEGVDQGVSTGVCFFAFVVGVLGRGAGCFFVAFFVEARD